MFHRVLLLGLAIYIISTIIIRLIGQHILKPEHIPWTVALYLVSFVAMALLVRLICRWMNLERDTWLKAAALLALPTLVLDAFSCAFFPAVFPNLDPAVAGLFGGWMLICCGGGVSGVAIPR